MIKVESHNGEAEIELDGDTVTIVAEICAVIRSVGSTVAENSSMTYRQAIAKILALIINLQEASDEG